MSPADVGTAAVPVARVVRGGVVESVHHGHLVAVDATGEILLAAGDPDQQVFTRSSLKPLQAVAMLRSGLQLDGPLLALACASHNGEPHHLEGARSILAGVGLDESALQNTPDYPLDDASSLVWRSDGRAKAPVAQNCSGKHSAMLATCVAAGWDTATYLAPQHPLQQAVRSTVAELTGNEPEHLTVDGCGAPLFSCSLTGLARSFGTIAAAAAGGGDDELARVGRAMNAHPHMVGGTGRDVTTLMGGVPGLVAKDGAEGVYAVGLPDGRGAALKVLDGSQRPRPVVMAALLRVLGVDAPVLDEVGTVPVLGHGERVGSVEAALPRATVRVVLQRVTSARVEVAGEVVGAVDGATNPTGQALLALVGVTHDDGPGEVATLARKVADLRVLEGERSAADAGAPVLVISQFTLYADTRRGRRPSWSAAAPGQVAEPLVAQVVEALRARGLEVATGRFGADMQVHLVNDGPVTVLLEA